MNDLSRLYSIERGDFYIDHVNALGYSSYGMHRHKYDEMLFVLKGNVQFMVDDKIYRSNGSCIIFFKERRLHTTEVDKNENYERYNIVFKQRYISDIVNYENIRSVYENDCGIIPLTDNEITEFLGYVKPLLNLYKTKSADGAQDDVELMQKHLLTLILLRVNNILKRNIDPGKYVLESYISNVVHYIAQNLDKKLIINELADMFFVSRVKLINDFKDATGVTIGDYITTQRLKFSKELLLIGKSVNETAIFAGFVNSCHFIRTFKKYNGITPLQYYKSKMRM